MSLIINLFNSNIGSYIDLVHSSLIIKHGCVLTVTHLRSHTPLPSKSTSVHQLRFTVTSMYLVSVGLNVYYLPVPLTWHFVQCVLKMHNHATLLNSTQPYGYLYTKKCAVIR